MHVHGQFFKVISRSGDRKGEEFFRDTIFVKPHEFVDVVMYTSDSGK
jgi:FtsP/CotA-like multicopper oxidase with cupredoxin domain